MQDWDWGTLWRRPDSQPQSIYLIFQLPFLWVLPLLVFVLINFLLLFFISHCISTPWFLRVFLGNFRFLGRLCTALRLEVKDMESNHRSVRCSDIMYNTQFEWEWSTAVLWMYVDSLTWTTASGSLVPLVLRLSYLMELHGTVVISCRYLAICMFVLVCVAHWCCLCISPSKNITMKFTFHSQENSTKLCVKSQLAGVFSRHSMLWAPPPPPPPLHYLLDWHRRFKAKRSQRRANIRDLEFSTKERQSQDSLHICLTEATYSWGHQGLKGENCICMVKEQLSLDLLHICLTEATYSWGHQGLRGENCICMAKEQQSLY